MEEKNSQQQPAHHNDDQAHVARPQVIATRQAHTMRRAKSTAHAQYHDGKSIKQATRNKKISRAHARDQEIEKPLLELTHQHDSRWTMYKDLRRYLNEIIKKKIDVNTVSVLIDGLNYHTIVWVFNDPTKNRRLALDGLSYLAEHNVKLVEDKEKFYKIVTFINNTLTIHADRVHRNIIEYSLMTLSHLIICEHINASEYIAAIQNGIDILKKNETDLNIYYPPIIIAILAKTLAGKPLNSAEVKILQQTCIYTERRGDLQQLPNFFKEINNSEKYVPDPWLYYSDDEDYYKKQRLYGEGEIGHLIDLLDTGKMADEKQRCKFIHALLNAVTNGQQIPGSYQQKLLGILKERDHHKSEFYSCLLLGALLRSPKFKFVEANYEKHAVKLHNMLSVWRGYAFSAYYKHLCIQKKSGQKIDYEGWKAVIEYWSRNESRPENGKYVTLILHIMGDVALLGMLSIEPKHCSSTLTIWLDSITNKEQLPVAVLDSLVTILDPDKKAYNAEHRELALYLLSSLLEEGKISERISSGFDQDSAEKRLERLIRIVLSIVGEKTAPSFSNEKLVALSLEILETQVEYHYNRQTFDNEIIRSLLTRLCRNPGEDRDLKVRVSSLFERLLDRGAMPQYTDVFGRSYDTQLLFANALKQYNQLAENDTDSKNVLNNMLLCCKHAAVKDYGISSLLLEYLSELLLAIQDEPALFTLLDTFKAIIEQKSQSPHITPKILGNLLTLVSSANRDVPVSVCFIICSFIKKAATLKQEIGREFYRVFNDKIFQPGDDAKLQQCLYFGTAILDLLAEMKYPIPLDTLILLNARFSHPDTNIRAKIIDIDLPSFQNFPCYSRDIVLALQRYDDSCKSILEDQLIILRSIIEAKNAPLVLVDITDDTCVVAMEIISNNENEYMLKQAALRLLYSVSQRKEFPKDLILELTTPLKLSDCQTKKMMLSTIFNQLNKYKITFQLDKKNNDYEILLSNVENCIFEEELAELTIKILLAVCQNNYILSTKFLDTLADIIFTHQKSETRGLAVKLLRMQKKDDSSKKVNEVYELERIAEALGRNLTLLDLKILHQCVKEGRQLTLNVLDSIERLLASKLVIAGSNDEAILELSDVVKALIVQQCDYAARWVNHLVQLVDAASNHARGWAHALSLLLIYQSISHQQPFNVLVKFVTNNNTDLIKYHMLEAIHVGAKIYGIKTIIPKPNIFLPILFKVLTAVNDDRTLKIRVAAINLVGLIVDHTNAFKKLSENNVILMKELLLRYLSICNEYEITVKLFNIVSNIKQICIGDSVETESGSRLVSLIKVIKKLFKDHADFHDDKISCNNKCIILSRLIEHEPFKKSNLLYEKAVGLLVTKECAYETKVGILELFYKHLSYVQLNEAILIPIIETLHNSDTTVPARKASVLAYRITIKMIPGAKVRLSDNVVHKITTLLKSSLYSLQCIYLADILKRVAQEKALLAGAPEYLLADFYNDVCVLSMTNRQADDLLRQVSNESLNGLAPRLINIIFDLFINGRLNESLFSDTIKRCFKSLPAKSKLIVLDRCFNMSVMPVAYDLFKVSLQDCDSSCVDEIQYDVSSMTIKQLELYVHVCQRVDYRYNQDVTRLLIKRLIACYDYNEQTALANLLHKMTQRRDVKIIDEDMNHLFSILDIVHKVIPPELPGNSGELKHDMRMIIGRMSNFYQKSSLYYTEFSKGPQFNSQIKSLIIRAIYQLYQHDHAAIKNLNRAYSTLLTHAKKRYSANAFAHLVTRLSDLSSASKFDNLIRMLVFNVNDRDINTEKDLTDTIKVRLLKQLEDKLDAISLNKLISRLEDRSNVVKVDILLLLDVLQTRIKESPEQANALTAILHSPLLFSKSRICPISFLSQCDNNILFSWFKTVLNLYARDEKVDCISLQQLAELTASIGFEQKSFDLFISKIPFNIIVGGVTTAVKRSEITTLLQFICDYQLEAHFLTVILPKTKPIINRNPIAKWLIELKQHFLYIKIVNLQSILKKRDIASPHYEELIDINELTRKMLLLIDKNVASFNECNKLIDSFFEAATKSGLLQGEQNPARSHFNEPNLTRLNFTIDFSLNNQHKLLDLSESLQKHHQDFIKVNFDLHEKDLPLDILCQQFISINQNVLSKDRIDNEISNIRRVINRSKELANSTKAGHEPIEAWDKNKIQSWAKSKKQNELIDVVKADYDAQTIAVLVRACKLIRRVVIRDAQLVALLSLIYVPTNMGRFLQVATGEGKSTIIAMMAIWQVLHNHTVDIVTSSPILAARDVNELKPLYDCFNINISHNDEDPNYIKGTKPCYQDHVSVVYGSASNFQFDILRHEYSFLETRGKRDFDVIVIDEVDNLLIDEGSKIAMLANTMPFFSYLNPIMIAIYKELERVDHNFRYHNNELFYRDEKSPSNDSEEKISNKEVKITEILKKHANELFNKSSSSYLRVPHHLKEYVQQQIDSWIRSAILAYYIYQPNHHYIIVQDTNYIDRITPVDYSNTGITQNGTTWGDGLQQFLEIKHGLKISPESIITNYLSNVAFIKRYIKTDPNYPNQLRNSIYGITGTLGSEDAKALLAKIYEIDFLNIPTYQNKKFKAYPPQLCESSDSWLANIALESIREASMERIVLVLCETIINAKMIAKVIKHYKSDINLIKYIVSDSKSALFSEKYQPRTIIVATNLAGRGTDIQLPENVVKNGGLHVIFTFLPDNLRVEKQGFGRAARMGQPGTGKYIISQDDLANKLMTMHSSVDHNIGLDDFDAILAIRDKNESHLLKQIQVFELPVIENKDLLFSSYRHLIAELKSQLKTGIIDSNDSNWFDDHDLEAVKDAIEERWGLWLKTLNVSAYSKNETQLKFNEFSAMIKADLKTNTVIKNPCYYINFGNRIAMELNSWWLKSIYSSKHPKFCRYAITCYDHAVNLDSDYSFTAYYNRAFIKLLLQLHDYKSEVLYDLDKATFFAKQLSAQLKHIGTIYSNNQSSDIKNDLSIQLWQESEIVNVLLSSISEVIDTIENQNRYLSLTVHDKKTSDSYDRLDKRSALDIIAKFTSASVTVDVNFHDLHPRHDFGVLSPAEEIINHLKMPAQCEVSFDPAKLVRQPTLQHALRKLLPINQYLNVDTEQDNAKKTESKEKRKEPITGRMIAAKGIGLLGAIPAGIDHAYHGGISRVKDWAYERHTYRTMPVTFIYSKISAPVAVEIIRSLISTLDELASSDRPEIFISYPNDTIDEGLSKLLVINYLKCFFDYDQYTVTTRSKSQANSQTYVDCSTLFANDANEADVSKSYRLTLKYTKYQKLVDSLIAQSDDSLTFCMKVHHVSQVIADKLIRLANTDISLSFSGMSPKSALAVADHCDNAMASAMLSIKALNSSAAHDLVNGSDPSKRVISALPRPIETVLLDKGFEKVDIDSHYHNGYLLLYQAYQKQLRPIRRIFIKAGLGAMQLAGGVALSVFTAGFGAALGGVLIAEGIGDLAGAAIAYRKGEMSFDGYVGHKAFNIGLGITLIGAGKLISTIKAAGDVANGLATGAEVAEVGFENLSVLAKLSSFFSGGTQTLSGFAKAGARFAAKKIITTTANSGIGKGTEYIANNYRAKIESQTRLIAKTQINNHHCKAALNKIFAYDRMLGSSHNYEDLQDLLAIKINQFNFTFSGANQDAMELAFETLFASSCEEIASSLSFKTILKNKLPGGRVGDNDLATITDILKEYGILRPDESINIDKLFPDKNKTSSTRDPSDYANHPINFKDLKLLKNNILDICFTFYQALQSDFFSEKNNLIKRCSNQISQQIMNEVMILATTGQMLASVAIEFGYSYGETALISQYEDWQIRKQGGIVEKINQEYVIKNTRLGQDSQLHRMQVDKRIKYRETFIVSGKKCYKEKLYFKNGATFTRLVESDLSAVEKAAFKPFEINLQQKDLNALLKGYSLTANDCSLNSSVSYDFFENGTTSWDDPNYVADSGLSINTLHSDVDVNFTKSINLSNVQFLYDGLTNRYIQTTRDSLHRHRFNKASTNFRLVNDTNNKSRLKASDDGFNIPVPQDANKAQYHLHSHDSFWNEFGKMLSDIANNGPIEYDDSDSVGDPSNKVAEQDYNAVKNALERAKSRGLSHTKSNSGLIRYNCFLERVKIASLTFYRYLTLQYATYNALVMKLNYDEMLVTWSHAYDDTLFQVEQIIQLLITVILANVAELLKQDQVNDSNGDEFFTTLRDLAKKCFHDCMTAGYAEQSYVIFLNYLDETQRNNDPLSQLMECLRSKFVDYHNLRYQLHRIETLYSYPSFSSGLFNAMKRDQLDRAIQNLSGMMIKGKSYQVGIIFQQGIQTPFGAVVSSILSTLIIKADENQYAKERMEKFLGNLIIECQNHEAILQQVLQSNEVVKEILSHQRIRGLAEELMSNNLKIESVLYLKSTEKLSESQADQELKNLEKLIDTCDMIIKQYLALINSHSGHILTKHDKHLLEHAKAKYLISRSMFNAFRNYQKFDLVADIGHVFITTNPSPSQDKHVGDDSAMANQQTSKGYPIIDFKRADELRKAYANALIKEVPKIAVLLQHPDGSVIEQYPLDNRVIMTPTTILDITLALEAKALTLYQTVSSVCYRVDTLRPNQNQAYLAFSTNLGFSGVLTALGVTRQEIRKILLAAIGQKNEIQAYAAVRSIQTAINNYLERHLRTGCNFERAYAKANLHVKWKMLDNYFNSWQEKQVVLASLTKLTQLLLIEFNKIDKEAISESEVKQWHSNDDIRANIKLLEKYILNKNTVHEMYLIANNIESKLQDAFVQLVGNSDQSRQQRRIDILLEKSSRQPWQNISAPLVVKYCQDNKITVPNNYDSYSAKSLQELLDNKGIIESYINDYLAHDYSEIDQPVFDAIINYLGLKVPIILQGAANLQSLININQEPIISRRSSHYDDELTLYCKATEDHIRLFNSLALPLYQIDMMQPIFQLRKSLVKADAESTLSNTSKKVNPAKQKAQPTAYRSSFFRAKQDIITPKKSNSKPAAGSHAGGVTKPVQMSQRMTDSNYWYSIQDGICLLRHIRSRFVQPSNRNDDHYHPYVQNNREIFLADPYHHSNFEEYFKDDINRLTAAGHFDKCRPWQQMPTLIVIPVLVGAHWISIRIDINYKENKVAIVWIDPFGIKGLVSDYCERFKVPLMKGCLQLIQSHKKFSKLGLKDIDVTHTISKIDQQGYGINCNNCGVITFANISNIVLDLKQPMLPYDSETSEKIILQRRVHDAKIVGQNSDDHSDVSTNRVNDLKRAQDQYRDNRLNTQYSSMFDNNIIHEVQDWPADIIDIFFTYVDIYQSLSTAYIQLRSDLGSQALRGEASNIEQIQLKA